MRVTIGLLASFLLFSPVLGLGAQTVEILAGQNGGAEYSEETESILSGCLDYLFQSGIIATNERPRELSPEAFADTSLGAKTAAEGYVDFLLSFLVTYGPSTTTTGRPVPLTIVWRVLRVSDNRVLGSGSFSPDLDKVMDQKKFDAGLWALGSDLARAFLPSFTTKTGLAPSREASAVSSTVPIIESSGQGVKP